MISKNKHLITCLGNPGKEYEKTRHNAGFIMAYQLINHYNLTLKKNKRDVCLYEGTILDIPVYLLMPQSYMNLSGEPVYKVLQYYGIPTTQLIVIYDDIDIEMGKVRKNNDQRDWQHHQPVSRLSDWPMPLRILCFGAKPRCPLAKRASNAKRLAAARPRFVWCRTNRNPCRLPKPCCSNGQVSSTLPSSTNTNSTTARSASSSPSSSSAATRLGNTSASSLSGTMTARR